MSSKIQGKWVLEYCERQAEYRVYHVGNKSTERCLGGLREAGELVARMERLRERLLTPGRERLMIAIRYFRSDYTGAAGDKARALEADRELLESDGLTASKQAGKLLADHLWKLIQSAEIEQDALLELGAKVAGDPRMHPARRSKVSRVIKEKAVEATARVDELTENTSTDAAI